MPLLDNDGVKLADGHADAAGLAKVRVDVVHLLLFASDGFGWAVASTHHAAGAGIENAVVNQLAADLGRAALFLNVRFVLVTEMANRRQNRVRRTLP